MKKRNKWIRIVGLMLVFLILASCGKKETKEEKFYDDDFVNALAKGLESRWKYIDENPQDNSADNYKKAIDTELKELEPYKDKKFKDDKLKELALAYINQLKEGKNAAEKFGSDSFYEVWSKHVNERTRILSEISNIKEIPVKDKKILDELLAKGKEVTDNKEKEQTIKDFITSITFVKNENESNEYMQKYEAIVENTTQYTFKSFSISINLINSEGVTVETTYANTQNWKPGSKVKLEFMTDKEFTTTEIAENFVDTE